MMQLIELFALGLAAVMIGSVFVVLVLQLLDVVFRVITFCTVKIFVDRSAKYATFNSTWDAAKKRL